MRFTRAVDYEARDDNEAHGLAMGFDRQGGSMGDIEARYRVESIERDYNGGRRAEDNWRDR